MINFQNSEFALSAAAAEGFPKDERPQIVFAGRSNVGKSSFINSLLRRKNLARVSGTPGKTANINIYDIDKKIWFIDLPGYGYAKVCRDEKIRWGNLMETYFAESEVCLAFLIVDSRHDPTDDDLMMADFFIQKNIPFVVIANKSDKLKKSELASLGERLKNIRQFEYAEEIIPYSSQKPVNAQVVLDKISSYSNIE